MFGLLKQTAKLPAQTPARHLLVPETAIQGFHITVKPSLLESALSTLIN